MDLAVTITLNGENFELTLNEATRLRDELDKALEWAPGWSTMIFVPPRKIPDDMLN